MIDSAPRNGSLAARPVAAALTVCEETIANLREIAGAAGRDVAVCPTVDAVRQLPVDAHDRIDMVFADAKPAGAGGLRSALECFPLTPCFLLVEGVGPDDAPSAEEGLREGSAILGRLARPASADALREALETAARFAGRRDEVFERYVFRNLPQFLEEPIARVIHDLNNQITGLKGGVDLLNYSIDSRAEAAEDDKTRRYMDQFILPSLAQIENLIMSWRRMRESHAEQTRPTELVTVARRAVRLAAAPAEWSRIGIRVGDDAPRPYADFEHADAEASTLWCLGNESNLVMALAHILRNAIEATADRQPPEILIVIGEGSDDMVVMRVEDNGPGIDTQQATEVWRSFFSTKSQFGLGLSLAKQVVDRLQGQIELATCSLGGAAVQILLPSSAPPAPTSQDRRGENAARQSLNQE